MCINPCVRNCAGDRGDTDGESMGSVLEELVYFLVVTGIDIKKTKTSRKCQRNTKKKNN